MADDRYRVQSVERAFALLEALADAGPEGMTLSTLGRSLGVSKSTAYAILQTLLAGGFVADAGTGMARRYRLGMALARLGDVVVSQLALRDVAMPEIRDLTAETGLASRLVRVLVRNRLLICGVRCRMALRSFFHVRYHCEMGFVKGRYYVRLAILKTCLWIERRVMAGVQPFTPDTLGALDEGGKRLPKNQEENSRNQHSGQWP